MMKNKKGTYIWYAPEVDLIIELPVAGTDGETREALLELTDDAGELLLEQSLCAEYIGEI